MFRKFPSIPRVNSPIVVTEKLDGTNGQIAWLSGDECPSTKDIYPLYSYEFLNVETKETRMFYLYAGSRNRYLTPESDNYGFASWVECNSYDLTDLGPGRHYGEWWGKGINRNYGQTGRKFSLFNVTRWTNEILPTCCSTVPVLYEGEETIAMDHTYSVLDQMYDTGSTAAPGFMKPEGIVVWWKKTGQMLKFVI
jgi:hypothetical protein